ncbi:hypothetical protein MPSEU_000042700 [Mayamaea pseudoterrestris]|nr:hypothetical protein MPSEU_000042700 [Mayamaea pseudoterrestris]
MSITGIRLKFSTIGISRATRTVRKLKVRCRRRLDRTLSKVVTSSMTTNFASSSSSSSSTFAAPVPPVSSYKSSDDERLIRLALRKNSFFSCLDDEQVERLVAAAYLSEYQPNDIIILEGCVDVYADDENDVDVRPPEVHLQRQTSASHGPADLEETVDAADWMDDVDAEGENGHDSQRLENNKVAATVNRPAVASVDAEDVTRRRTTVDDAAADDESDGTTVQSGTQEPFEYAESVTEAVLLLEELEKTREEAEEAKEDIASTQPLSRTYTSSSNLATVQQSTKAMQQSTTATQHEYENNDSILPPPPQSDAPRALYIVRQGRAHVVQQVPGRFSANHSLRDRTIRPASLGPGAIFGEGGFLFGRQHSASVVAGAADHDNRSLQCWVVDYSAFRNHVLPSCRMNNLFLQYATKKDARGTFYLTLEEFVQAWQELYRSNNIPTSDPLVDVSLVNLYRVLNRRRGDRSNDDSQNVYLADFCFLHLLMARPDPEVDLAFLLFDEQQSGRVFMKDVHRCLHPYFPSVNYRSEFFQNYFGKDASKCIRQSTFPQFLVELQRELGQQSFWQTVDEQSGSDRRNYGCLPPEDFVRVLTASSGGRLPRGVIDRLESLSWRETLRSIPTTTEQTAHSSTLEKQSSKSATQPVPTEQSPAQTTRSSLESMHFLDYADFVAFQEVIAVLPGICNLINKAQAIKGGPVSADDFKVANKAIGFGNRLSRRQVEIVFSLFDVDCDGFVDHDDTVRVCGIDFVQRLAPDADRGDALTLIPPAKARRDALENNESDSVGLMCGDSVAQVSLSTFATIFAVVVCYPFDVIKTRLMNQRIVERRLYANSLDCYRQIFRFNGFAGLYRGLLPQLLLSAPEKAIKLHVNDLIMNTFRSSDNKNDPSLSSRESNVFVEALAGACAGACQLLVSNPMELSKTRLILHDEMLQLYKARTIEPPRLLTLTGVVRELGFPQILVHGATACLLRDITFSAIYFPGYAASKRYLADIRPDGQITLSDVLIAGTLAAVPSAILTTPFDVIRVRLQAIPGAGELGYAGIRDCARKIYELEGTKAFFQGALPRMLRVAPQFSLALLAYERLARFTGVASACRPPTDVPLEPKDYIRVFSTSNTMRSMEGDEN